MGMGIVKMKMETIVPGSSRLSRKNAFSTKLYFLLEELKILAVVTQRIISWRDSCLIDMNDASSLFGRVKILICDKFLMYA